MSQQPSPVTTPASVVTCIDDSHYHLCVRLPDGYGFAVSWRDEHELVAAITTLADVCRQPAGIRAGIEQVVMLLSGK